MNYLVKFLFAVLSLSLVGGLVTSCSDTDDFELLNVEDYVDDSIHEMESLGKIGKRGCNEFIFPISVDFPDGTSSSVDDYETLKETIKEWKESNPEADEKPSLAFPIEVMTEDGELITVADREELKELRRACRRSHFDGPRRARRFFRTACFKPVFPISVEFPNGSIFEAANRGSLKAALRAWKESAGETDEKPSVVYPITVEYEDGTQVEAASREELKALKDECDQDDEG